jgi:hypothetical protein
MGAHAAKTCASAREKKTRANIAALLVRGSRHLKHDGCITAAGEQKKNWPRQGVSSSKTNFSKILKLVQNHTFENLHHCPQERAHKEEALLRLHAVFRTCKRVSLTTKKSNGNDGSHAGFVQTASDDLSVPKNLFQTCPQ